MLLQAANAGTLAEEDAVTSLRELTISLFANPIYRDAASDVFLEVHCPRVVMLAMSRNGGLESIFAKAAALFRANGPASPLAAAAAAEPCAVSASWVSLDATRLPVAPTERGRRPPAPLSPGGWDEMMDTCIGDHILVVLQMLSAGPQQLKLTLVREGIFDTLNSLIRKAIAPKTLRYARMIAVVANLCRGDEQCKANVLKVDPGAMCKNLRAALGCSIDLSKMNCLGLIHTLTIGSENRRSKMATLVVPVCRLLGPDQPTNVRKMAAVALRAMIYGSVARKHIALQDCQTVANLKSLLPPTSLSTLFFGHKGQDGDIYDTVRALEGLAKAAWDGGLDREMELIKHDLIELKRKAYQWALDNQRKQKEAAEAAADADAEANGESGSQGYALPISAGGSVWTATATKKKKKLVSSTKPKKPLLETTTTAASEGAAAAASASASASSSSVKSVSSSGYGQRRRKRSATKAKAVNAETAAATIPTTRAAAPPRGAAAAAAAHTQSRTAPATAPAATTKAAGNGKTKTPAPGSTITAAQDKGLCVLLDQQEVVTGIDVAKVKARVDTGRVRRKKKKKEKTNSKSDMPL